MKNKKKKIILRIPNELYQIMIKDLKRPHLYAHERVGFLLSKSKTVNGNTIIVTFFDYTPVEDENYIDDSLVGAKINSAAIRNSMGKIIKNNCGVFHVHLHSFFGTPFPSKVDKKGIPPVVKCFYNTNPLQEHGFLIISKDSFYCEVIENTSKKFQKADQFSVVGYPMKFNFQNKDIIQSKGQYERQSFLGENS